MGAVEWTLLKYLEAGAYIAIMLAVAGAPQMLSSYFDIRMRREDRREDQRLRREEQAAAEANAERRHREKMELRREDAELRYRAEREEAECRHWGQERRHWYEECRRQDEERRHREVMLMLAVVIGERRRQERADLLRTLQGVIDDLRTENARLRGERSDAADRDR